MRYLTEYSFVTTILVIPTNTDFPKQRVTEGGQPIVTKNDGVVRGLIGEGTSIPEGDVGRGLSSGHQGPMGNGEYCFTVSEKLNFSLNNR